MSPWSKPRVTSERLALMLLLFLGPAAGCESELASDPRPDAAPAPAGDAALDSAASDAATLHPDAVAPRPDAAPPVIDAAPPLDAVPEDPCAAIVCAAGRRCDPETLLCGLAPAACDLVAQDCPDPAESCTVLQDSTIGCAPAGPVPAGERCGTADTGRCSAGNICAGTEAGGFTCMALCEADTGRGCGDRGCCGALAGLERAGVCETAPESCDPIGQDCGDGLKCTIATQCGQTGCEPAGEAPEGGACGTRGVDDCAPGLICLGSETFECARLCRVQADCPPELNCHIQGEVGHCMGGH